MARIQDHESHLLSTLQSHCIPLGTNDVSWAFSSKHAGELREYIEKYLGEETLLSLEEFDVYNHLSSSTQKSLRKDTDITLISPRSEEDFRLDTADLKRETEMLRRHTRLLKEQKAALKKTKQADKEARKRRKEAFEVRKNKWGVDLEQLRSSIDDLISTIAAQVSQLQENHKIFAAQPAEHTKPLVDSVLDSDDKIIAKLEEITETIEAATGDATEDLFVQEVEQLATQLSNLMTSKIRLKLDHRFIESYNKTPAPSDPTDPAQLEEVETDLESLQAEIQSVARGHVEEKYVRPLITDIRKRKAEEQRIAIQRAEWIAKILSLLSSRLLRISEALTYGLQSGITLSTFISELSTILLPQQQNTPPSHSPERRSSSPTKTPLRSRRQQLPEHTLLAHLGAPIPTNSFAARTPGLYTPGAPSTLAPTLSAHLSSQLSRLHSKITSLQAESSLPTSFNLKAELTLHNSIIQILLDEVEAEVDWGAGTSWEEVFLGAETAGRVKDVQMGGEEGKALVGVLSEVRGRVVSSRAKDEFVGRWSRQ